MSQPILSICIPTYNRAEYLRKTLDSIVSQPRFQNTDDVEIVISDNCSPDNTPDIVMDYVQKYGGKIRYFRNDTNVFDKNLELSMSRGRGLFIKSHNDTLLLHDGALDIMCDFLQQNAKEKPIIFFLNHSHHNGISIFNNADDFISHISIYSTWIGGFGLWKSDFDKIKNFSRFARQRLPQTDVMFGLMEQKNNFAVMNDALFIVQSVINKGGYNIAEVFGNNYMILLRRILDKKIISPRVFNQQMKRMLKHINRFYFDIKNEYSFTRGDYWHHMHDWHFKPYFYTSLISVGLKKLTFAFHK